jgi:hypothetical protein
MDLKKIPDAVLLAEIEKRCADTGDKLVAELMRRFNEQGLRLTVKVDASAALEEIGVTAAHLAKLATERNAILDEVADELEGRRKGGFWAIGDAHGNHVRDQSFFRAICAVKELKAKEHG